MDIINNFDFAVAGNMTGDDFEDYVARWLLPVVRILGGTMEVSVKSMSHLDAGSRDGQGVDIDIFFPAGTVYENDAHFAIDTVVDHAVKKDRWKGRRETTAFMSYRMIRSWLRGCPRENAELPDFLEMCEDYFDGFAQLQGN